MRATLFSAATLAAAICGCADQGGNSQPAHSATAGGTTSSTQASANGGAPTVTLYEANDGPDRTKPPEVAPRAEMRVRFAVPVDPVTKRAPHAIVQIVRREGGRDVMYNSATAKETREGDLVKFESVIKAPAKKGSFHINAVQKGEILRTSGLEVN